MAKKKRKLITEDDITYGEAEYYSRKSTMQDVFIKKKMLVPAMLLSTDGSWLSAPQESYHIEVKENAKNKKYDYYYSEEEGYIILKFKTVEEFLNYINNNPNLFK